MSRSWTLVPFIAVVLLAVLFGCTTPKPKVQIEEIQYRQGSINADYAELYAKVVVSGDLSRADIQITKESFPGFSISEDYSKDNGLSVFYDVYDSNSQHIVSAIKDGREEKCITIPNPVYSTKENPVYYFLEVRIRVDNRQIDKALTTFILTKPDSLYQHY